MSIERETFPALAADGGLFAVATDDYWLDVGRPELYLQANLDLLAGAAPAVAVPPHDGVTADASTPAPSCARAASPARRRSGPARSSIGGRCVLAGAVDRRGAVVARLRRHRASSAPGPPSRGAWSAPRPRLPRRQLARTIGSPSQSRTPSRPGATHRVTVLVIGGAGFLGSHLVDRLVADGVAVDVVDDLSTGTLGNLADAADGAPAGRRAAHPHARRLRRRSSVS